MTIDTKPAALTATTPTTRARFDPLFLLLIGALAALGPFSIDLYLPAFGAIATDLRARPEQVQTTLSAYFVGLAIGQVAMGPLSDRFGRKVPLIGGLVLYTVASIGCATASTVDGLALWRVLQAVGACSGIVASRAILRDRFEPRDMARALSMVMLVMGLAPIVAPLVGAAAHEAFGWRVLFLGLAVYGTVVALAVGFGLGETLPAERRRKKSVGEILSGYVDLLKVRPFIGYSVAGSLAMAAMYVYISAASFVFTDLYGLSSGQFAMLFGLNAVGLITGSQVNERLLRRTSPDVLIPIALGVQTLAAVTLAIAALTGVGGMLGVAIPLFVVLTSMGFTFPNTTAAAMGPVGDRAGLASALLGTLQYGIAGVGTFAASMFYTGTAVPMAAGMAAFSVAGLIALAVMVPRD